MGFYFHFYQRNKTGNVGLWRRDVVLEESVWDAGKERTAAEVASDSRKEMSHDFCCVLTRLIQTGTVEPCGSVETELKL